MGLLDSFEKGLERAVNGAFAKTFRSGIQPVEIAAALRSEMDKNAAIVSRDRILSPHSFTVRLAPSDDDRMQALGSTLITELTDLVNTHARTQGYSFAGPVRIVLARDESVSTGTLRVSADSADAPVTWRGVLEVDGTRHPLAKSRTVIGRGSDADITISDTGASRKHAEVLWDGERAMVRDMKSTNGTQLNGSPVTEAALAPDSTIQIGRTRIVFRVIAQTAAPQRAQPQTDATRAFRYDEGGPRA